MTPKEVLVTSGFPRSGNTYLNYALKSLYYPNNEVNLNKHTVFAVEQSTKIMVPFRAPLDCIASWNNYPSNYGLDMDIKYYLRFYNYCINNPKVIFMNFDYFTTDLDYIKTKVKNNFDLDPVATPTVEEVKVYMVKDEKVINLPQNNQTLLNRIKEDLEQTPGYEQCVDLYRELVG
jgi:hypothetical protein